MEKRNNSIYTAVKSIGIPVLVLMVLLSGCSKSDDPVITPPVVTPPAAPTPTGDIQTFTLNDSIVAYNSGTFAKWLVNNTNNYTVVTFNGVKVSLYGVINTGPLKQTTLFTLSVNNGKTATATLKVADSLTTQLWNKGKSLRQTSLQFFIVPMGDSVLQWVDTTLSAKTADQLNYFALTGNVKTVQLSTMYTPPPPASTFVTDPVTHYFTWNGLKYFINTLDADHLVVTYNMPQPNGTTLQARNIYKFEL